MARALDRGGTLEVVPIQADLLTMLPGLGQIGIVRAKRTPSLSL